MTWSWESWLALGSVGTFSDNVCVKRIPDVSRHKGKVAHARTQNQPCSKPAVERQGFQGRSKSQCVSETLCRSHLRRLRTVHIEALPSPRVPRPSN